MKKSDSQSAKVAISLCQEADVRPFAIVDVMLFLLFTSLLLAFTTYVETFKPEFAYPTKVVDSVLQISWCCLNAACLALLSILATRRFLKGFWCPHPGHWLILGLGAIAASTVLSESLYLFGSDLRGFPSLRAVDVMVRIIGWLVAIGLCFLFARNQRRKIVHHWNLCIWMFILCAMLGIVVELCGFLGFWNRVAASWSQGIFLFIAALVAIVCAMRDMSYEIDRDWIHWAGVAAFVAVGCYGGFRFALYNYYVVCCGAKPA